MSADNIILNSSQYAPIYIIESPSVSQARQFILAPNNQSLDKPASESLKRFYENSGKLESNLNTAESSQKPRVIKKNENCIVGNNLKLASFLLPKCETKNDVCKPILAPVNNVVLKPVYIANNINVNNINTPSPVPKLDVNSRIVKLKDLPNIVRSQNGKILPKIKPKEISPSNKQKHSPVQFVKLGETYHSINQLNNDQMKIVNHAMKMFNGSQANSHEPTYDPVTNTKFIYKVVSQKDLIADRNKANKQINLDIKKEIVKLEKEFIEDEPKINSEAKITRSGRVVKLPKNIIVDDSPTKLKRKICTIVSCLQCGAKFSSPQRLHRHYENHPGHLPTKLHNNLFHCLIAIVTAGSSESERANILIEQLELFIKKLRSCIPCLINNGDNETEKCNLINEDLSKLLGINSGKYNFNIDALNCEKDVDGYCTHNPRPLSTICTDTIKSQIENLDSRNMKAPTNILKSNLSERRPTILRKVECRKQKLEQSSNNISGKKIKLTSDLDTNANSLVVDNIVTLLSDTTKTDNNLESKPINKLVVNGEQEELRKESVLEKVMPKPSHTKFHSTHFDIRSSPIKPTSTVFRKFQINPEKMAKYEIEIIRPIQLNQLAQDVEMKINNSNDQQINPNSLTNKSTEPLNHVTYAKSWAPLESNFHKTNVLINDESDNFIKPSTSIEPALLHVIKDTKAIKPEINITKSNNLIEETPVQNDSIINKANETDDFMKPDILIEQAILLAQDHKIKDKITDETDDFIKSNILIEPSLLDNRNLVSDSNFSDPTDSFLNSNVYTDSLSHVSNDSKISSGNGQSEIDIDLSISQGQSIINFLESLGNELTYTETESRNNSVDFQLDLFSFNN